ncbi:methyl-accepting chemotaxis protein [Proteinivorax hydrogeniformans]|uniref:Methyl-accepting chemotaxis protein n=1 Tax=Proteinivorax hydrogeniformans TaxID=1826727 RepID=A0AAU8HUE5_9FIRM
MNSIKTRLIILISLCTLIAAIIPVTLGFISSDNVTRTVMDVTSEDRLSSTINLLEDRIKNEMGDLSLDSGQLVTEDGHQITDQHDVLLDFAKRSGTEVTIFKRSGGNFVRVLTSITDEKGDYVVGTELEHDHIHKEVIEGNNYIGEANILDEAFITKYVPITDGNNEVIGLYFTGMSVNDVNNLIGSIRDQGVLVVAIVTIVIIVLSLIASYLIGAGTTKPIINITNRLERLASLDFTDEEHSNIDKYTKRKDEIGTMASAYNIMKKEVSALIKASSNFSEQLAASAEELSATSEEFSKSSEEVAKSVEEIAKGATSQAQVTEKGTANINDLGTCIETNQDNVDKLNIYTKEIDSIKNDSSGIVNNLTQKNKQTNDAIVTINDNVLETNKGVQDITEANEVIKNIAGQTSLLALNAAIEAARAGEAGKGFSVVAEEISKLAAESAKSAEQVSKTIEKLSNKSNETVKVMEDTESIVLEQSDLVTETKSKFEQISDKLKSIEASLKDVNDSGHTMLIKKDEIVSVIENIAALAQQNAAGTEEITASTQQQSAASEEITRSSEELAKLAEELRGNIAKFKL